MEGRPRRQADQVAALRASHSRQEPIHDADQLIEILNAFHLHRLDPPVQPHQPAHAFVARQPDHKAAGAVFGNQPRREAALGIDDDGTGAQTLGDPYRALRHAV